MAIVRKVVLCFFLQAVVLVAAVKDDPMDRIGFDGTGYAIYPPIDPLLDESNSTRIRFHVAPEQDTGLVLYIGPAREDLDQPLQDFVALELRAGLPVLVVDYGTWNIFELETHICSVEVPPGNPFTVELLFRKSYVEMNINENMCRVLSGLSRSYRVNQSNPGFLNSDDPLMLGGISVDGQFLAKAYEWVYVPQKERFQGCLSNFTVNGLPFDLSMPTVSKGVCPGCLRSCHRAKPATVPKDLSPNRHHYIFWMVAFAGLLGLLEVIVLVYRALNPSVQFNDRDIELQETRGGGGEAGAEAGAEGGAQGGAEGGAEGDDGEPDDGKLPKPTELSEMMEEPVPQDASIDDEYLRRIVFRSGGNSCAMGSMPWETFEDETELLFLRGRPRPLHWERGALYGEEASFLEL